jgi:1,3-beta-glucan synthase
VTRGGISKPTKTLCVSEVIFGAFNSVLKGGHVIHREYITQGKGKDLGFDACALFEQKISSGNAEQALS